MKYDARSEQTLMTELWDPNLADHPELFVRFVYPWGQPNTPLEQFKGPRAWQEDGLQEVGEYVRAQRGLKDLDLPGVIHKGATASGRGIGKSALLGMLAHWHLTTRIGSTTLVSANGEPQLRTTTFPEIKKWVTLALNAHWFELNAMAVTPAEWYRRLLEDQLKINTAYHYIQAKLWTEENPDAYAGPHSQTGMFLIFDEASGIPVPIWSTAEGYFTDVKNPCRLWLAFSNPRRNSGGFHDCFNILDSAGKPYWSLRQIDSRTVEDTDRAHFERIIERYGIDSDTARVEVLGQFPRQGDRQFIPSGVAREAQNRKLEADPGAALVMGVDVARFGDDSNVVRFRQGRDARSIPPVRWKGTDFVQTADRVAWLMDKFNPDAVFIDQGLGSAVVDILKAKGYRTTEVAFGSSAENPEYANKRTEMYARARDWLPGGMIDECPLLFGDLTSVEYDFVGAAKDKIGLERKDNLKTRIGRSPDDGDAFVLTFAGTVARRDLRLAKGAVRGRTARDVDYSVFGG